jgi:hypothetical protein
MIAIEARHQPGEVTIPVAVDIAAGPGRAQTQQFAVSAREDDAREASNTVVVVKELFLTVGHKDNLVALRFAGVTIPREAAISSAVLHLTATRKDSAYPIKIRYLGEAADHSAPLAAEPGSLSERLKTVSFVDDAPGPWPMHRYSRSPDLSRVLAEIVFRPQWRPGNALTIFIADNGSSGRRGVCAFDDQPGCAAVLTVTYQGP